MSSQQHFQFISITVILVLSLLTAELGECKGDNQFEIFQKSPKEIFEVRGFNATNLFYITKDGYILNVVKATNPLINGGLKGLANRVPLLFVHGFLTNAQGFLINSKGVSPKDYSKVDVESMSKKELRKFLKGDPIAMSLPFLALCFGHEVYVLERRGTTRSLGHMKYNSSIDFYIRKMSSVVSQLHDKIDGSILDESSLSHSSGLKSMFPKKVRSEIVEKLVEPLKDLAAISRTIDPKFWDYSYDEQAVYDIPGVTKLVLKISRQKQLAYIGHSAGGALAYMALTLNKNFNRQVKKALLWAPAINLGVDPYKNPLVLLLTAVGLKPFNAYVGPIVPPILTPIIQDILAIVCKSKLIQSTVCQSVTAFVFGPSGGFKQEIIASADLGAAFESVSSHEADHLLQFISSGRKSYHFDYGLEGNMEKYGRKKPPVIDLSKITTKSLSIWYGEYDTLVSPADVRASLEDLRVPYKEHYISSPGLFFNHGSFLFNRQADHWLNIPSYYEITH